MNICVNKEYIRNAYIRTMYRYSSLSRTTTIRIRTYSDDTFGTGIKSTILSWFCFLSVSFGHVQNLNSETSRVYRSAELYLTAITIVCVHNSVLDSAQWSQVRVYKCSKEALVDWSPRCSSTFTSSLTSSVAVLAYIPLRSPQKLFIFIIKKIIFWVKVSKNKRI